MSDEGQSIIVPPRHIRLSSITADGPMVRLNMSDGTHKLINRKEALERAKAISVGLDSSAPDLVEALITAVNQAKINDPADGKPYKSTDMDKFLKGVRGNVTK